MAMDLGDEVDIKIIYPDYNPKEPFDPTTPLRKLPAGLSALVFFLGWGTTVYFLIVLITWLVTVLGHGIGWVKGKISRDSAGRSFLDSEEGQELTLNVVEALELNEKTPETC